MLRINKINKGCILSALFSLLLILSLSSCINDNDEIDSAVEESTSLPELKLSFVIPNAVVATRATVGTEEGVGFENEINISDHDFRVYFFTYDESDENYEKGGTLLAEFTPTRTTSSSSGDKTIYTVFGSMPNNLLDETKFRAVVLANWGNTYPEVTINETTIAQLTEAANSTFLAEDKFELNDSQLIPFYGVQEFSGVDIKEGGITELSDEVSLLRALAKVEVVLNIDDDISFTDVILHNYNAEGYCAPEGIYLSEDYNTGDLDKDYVQDLHLVGGENDNADNGEGISFKKTKNREVNESTGEVTQHETWALYIPEYNNMYDDYSYITVTVGGEEYPIYFANYDNGVTDAYVGSDTSSRLNIHRNNLYRFYVSLGEGEYRLIVNVQEWENVFNNEWIFGEYSHLIYSDSSPNYFTDDNGYIYASLVVEGNEVDVETPTVYLQKVDNSTITSTGYVSIPETVTYLGYTYTVVQIGSYCFEADTGVIFINIPSTITYIDTDAFHNDLNLSGIAVHSENPPECAYDAFDGDDLEAITLYVPTNAVETYKSISPWSSFTNIVGVDFDN